MKRYYQQHTYAIDLLFGEIDELNRKDYFQNKKIIVFGTSRAAKIMISYILKIGHKVSYIIDNACCKETKPIMEIGIFKPEELLGNFMNDALVLIASAHQDEMIKQLEAMGYEYGKHMIRVIDLPKICDDFSYVDRTGYKELNNDEVREVQTGLLKYLKTICEKNNIWYSLAYGTLLGAVRHKGYIPWDDDIDVYMMADDVKQFERAAENERYQLIYSKNCPESYVHMAYLVDTSTVLDYNIFTPQSTTGIGIDVFILYQQPNDEQYEEYFSKIIDLETAKWFACKDKVKCLECTEELETFLESYSMEKCSYIGNVLSPYCQRDRFSKSVFVGRDMLLFEDEMYCVIANYNEYLTRVYGDYMKLPPENRRGRRHHYKAYKLI